MTHRPLTISCIITSIGKKSSFPHLQQALRSLSLAKYPGLQLTIVLITEAGVQKQQFRQRKNFTHVITPKSCGFGCKNNIGIYLAIQKNNADYVLLLNDDAKLASNFFLQLSRIVVNQNPDVLVPLIYSATDTKKIDAFGMEIFTSGYAHDSTVMDANTCWGTAACIVYKATFVKNVITTFGFFFNPLFHYYYEDVELAFRGLSLKPALVKSSQLVAFHHRSLTAGIDSDFNIFNTLKNYLWYVIMSWPASYLRKNWWRFGAIYLWLVVKNCYDGKVLLIGNVLLSTFRKVTLLIEYRKKITSKYSNDFPYPDTFSDLLFRTRKNGVPIKL